MTSKLYVYTVRRCMKNNIPQYTGLIPKNFDLFYRLDGDRELLKFRQIILKSDKLFGEIKDFFNKDENVDAIISKLSDLYALLDEKTLIKNKYDTRKKSTDLLEEILDKEGLIHKIANITDEDKKKIIEMNIDIIESENINSDDEKLKFIEHIFRAHDDMQYGIYFSLILASDDKDLKKKICNETKNEKEHKIVYYLEFDKLLDMCDELKTKKNFKLPILYVNKGWDYGKISDTTIIFNNSKEEFSKNVHDKYNNKNTKLNRAELICQIPLDKQLFRNCYQNYSQRGGYEQKYIKYKKKYLNLKKQLL